MEIQEETMPRRFIDISVPLEAGIKSDPEFMLPKITYHAHKETAADLCALFPGMTPDQLPDGMGWAIEDIELTTHNGTHVDAPWHYHPTMDGGERAITIDEVPLEWCYQAGVKFDFRHLKDGYLVTPDDMKAELDRIGHALQPLDIIVVNTSAGERYGEDDYLNKGCGFGRESTLWLTDRGVRVVGTDAWTWDAPFPQTLERWLETKDPSIIWEGHKAGAEKGYCQIEKMGNLDQLPSTGFDVICFPTKIKGASGGWTRAVGVIND
jgi:kynurenine formamidase